MNTKEYEAKEALLFMVHDAIRKIDTNRYLIVQNNMPLIIDVDSNEILKSEHRKVVYATENQIITISNEVNDIFRREDKVLLEVLDNMSLEVIYKTDINSAYLSLDELVSSRIDEFIKNAGITTKNFGQLKIISFDRTSVILDKNNNIIIDKYIVDCTYNKIWFSNGYHINCKLNRLTLENKMNVPYDIVSEIVTDYTGTEIIQVFKQKITKETNKIVNISAKYNMGMYGTGTHDIKHSCYIETRAGINKDLDITDAYKCSTARDAITIEKKTKGKIYRGCVDIKSGKELIKLRQGVLTFRQINSDIFAIIYEDAINDGIEIVSLTNGTIINKGIINYVDTRFTFLPLAEFKSLKYGTFILGNDYKLYSFETKNICDYTVADIANAYDVVKLTDGTYRINMLGESYNVTEFLRVLIGINLDSVS